MRKILFLDDDLIYIKKISLIFKEYQFQPCQTWEQAKDNLEKEKFNLFLLDLNLDSSNTKLEGLDLIRLFKVDYTEIPLIVVTNDQNDNTIVKAINLGADNFLRKSELEVLDWCLKFKTTMENHELKVALSKIESKKFPFYGNSYQIKKIKKDLEIFACTPNITLLITGETGVGKEVAAKYLHTKSLRRYKPFVAVNISSYSETLLESALFGHVKGAFTDAKDKRDGFFKQAEGGILFLDEIGDLSLPVQVKLLRAIETKMITPVGSDTAYKLDIQIISATNKNIEKMIAEGNFRADLYYRLKNAEIKIPPLRERKEDILEIIDFYLRQADYSLSIIEENVLTKLAEYPWPGNIRELKNTLVNLLFIKTATSKDIVDMECLPQNIRDNNHSNPVVQNSLDYKLAEVELDIIDQRLNQYDGKKDKTATSLGLNSDQLKYRIDKNRKKYNELVNYFKYIKQYYSE
ncbi:sigma-54-dependent Fis family transcriptional regulator [bacterium]|nr:sigma-54-dependent Fis family transcriptional regulator [bacterium]